MHSQEAGTPQQLRPAIGLPGLGRRFRLVLRVRMRRARRLRRLRQIDAGRRSVAGDRRRIPHRA
jgi:hypothetical protein